jgi:hypothetical protein
MSAERRDDADERLGEALRGAPLPATPAKLGIRVQELLRKRRNLRLLVSTAAAAGLLLGAVGLLSLQPAGHGPEEVKVAEQNGMKELKMLLAAPPVVSVAPEQDAWLAALDQELKEIKR